ncbi:DNA polymerase domain-containing protein [Leptospira wolffii]|uniref:DNA-directed DNA polymerase n=1 Tax=Leptospira wolffii TaxID=409998 RepID=A0ABV5BU57_9LEPT
MSKTFEGYLLDLYDLEGNITLWVKGENETRSFHDTHYPTFYVKAEKDYERKFVGRLKELNALLKEPDRVTKLGFYDNEPTSVLKICLSRPSVLRTIYHKIFAFYEKADVYHSDIELTTSYLYAKNLFPLAKVRVIYDERNRVTKIDPLSDLKYKDYDVPYLTTLEISFKENHRIGYSKSNPLVLSSGEFREELYYQNIAYLLHRINEILLSRDPDIILSSYGDQSIFPFLFYESQKHRIKLAFDRDKGPITRKVQTKGTSFETYGQVIYRAPNYPLFGRLHIDSNNSFVFKESFLLGIIELARLSRIPIQRMARASTGTALTNIEMAVALKRDYLVPWQKAALERPKTLYELIRNDKGGLVTIPNLSTGSVLENVAQLDFAQMYPSIMSKYNISPETVNCICCDRDETKTFIPGTGYHICSKRRGVVSEALEDILERRKYYKEQIEKNPDDSSIYEARQNALKWMLVTSFGYLGYRNAKFGRLESHESVTAIGREVLLIAKEEAEDAGYLFLHAITDSLFISKPNEEKFSRDELLRLCERISERTKIQLKIEGIYDWLFFPASKTDHEIGVVNRYFGKFSNGEIKKRGIFVRRKDMPTFIKLFQTSIFTILESCSNRKELHEAIPRIEELFYSFVAKVENDSVPIADLFLRRTISKGKEEYVGNNASNNSLQSLAESGITVEPGEKIKFLVTRGYKGKRIYLPEETALKSDQRPVVHKEYYRGLLIQAMEEIVEHLLPREYFKALKENQLLLPMFSAKNFEACVDATQLMHRHLR